MGESEPSIEKKSAPREIVWEVPYSRTMGVICLLIGLPVAVLCGVWVANDPTEFSAIALTICGAALAITGGVMVTRRLIVTATPEAVTVERSVFGITCRWSDVPSVWIGVLLEAKTRSTWRTHVPGYALELIHPQRGRPVMLKWAEEESSLRVLQMECCRLLGLPGLIRSGEGFETIPPDEIGRSVAALAAEGRIDETFDAALLDVPPAGVEVRRREENEVFLAITRKNLTSVKFILLGLITAAVMLAVIQREIVWEGYAVAGFGVLIALVGLGFLLYELLTTEVLRIAPGRIEIGRETWRGPKVRFVMTADEIERVYVGKTSTASRQDGDPLDRLLAPAFRGRDGVVLRGAERQHVVGEALTRNGLEWLRRLIMSYLAR